MFSQQLTKGVEMNKIGLTGIVTPKADDVFVNEFQGTCVGVRHGNLQVRDMDDNVYEIDEDQFAIN